MPITQMQLESIKAANLAKSVTWEASKFLPGDIVMTHGHTVRRTENAWICTTMGLQYATLSRWARAKLKRNNFNVKWCTFLMVGPTIVQMCCVPPPGERHMYSPWTAGRPRYFPAPAPPAPAATAEAPHSLSPSEQLDSRIDSLDGRLDNIAASAADQQCRLKNLEDRTESGQEDLHRRLIALQAEVAELKERLLATAAVAAHISLFKDRIAALEAKA